MTAINIWSPHRYSLECFEETLQHHHCFRRQVIGPVTIKYHEYLNGTLIPDIARSIRPFSDLPTINIVIIDDHDLEYGLDIEQSLVFFRNLINLSRVFIKSSFVICDVIDFILVDSKYPFRDLKQFKGELRKLVRESDIINIYSDHAGDIDGEVCDENSHLTEAGFVVLANLIAEDLANLPVKQF